MVCFEAFGGLVSVVAEVETRDRLGGGLKKLSSVLGRFAVAIVAMTPISEIEAAVVR